MATTHSKYKNKKRWEKLSKEDKLMSHLNREKNNRHWSGFKYNMEIFCLNEKVRHDGKVIKLFREKYPDTFKEIIKEVGKLSKRRETKIKFIEENNPSPVEYVGARAMTLLKKLKTKPKKEEKT